MQFVSIVENLYENWTVETSFKMWSAENFTQC